MGTRESGRLAGVLAAALLVCSASAISPCVAAERNAGDGATRNSPELLDEVTVSGTRLYQMRKAIIKVEDQFYELYNALNEDKQYDISCGKPAATGTLIAIRACEPQFVRTATEDEARGLLDSLVDGGASRALPADQVIISKQVDYTNNMLAILRKNPKLRALVRQQAEMQRKYDVARHERMKGRLVLFE
jgi:hypothetical protein